MISHGDVHAVHACVCVQARTYNYHFFSLLVSTSNSFRLEVNTLLFTVYLENKRNITMQTGIHLFQFPLYANCTLRTELNVISAVFQFEANRLFCS
jgi:hypothetical protein